ncbi:MAG: hypothetical protein FJY65_10390 [Calditrichaeota bacterium]|nr:hypothetical protein [Calditrichota bacterium]
MRKGYPFIRLIVAVFTIAAVYPLQAQIAFPPEGKLLYRPQTVKTSTAAVLSGGRLCYVWAQNDTDGLWRVYSQIVSPYGKYIFPEDPPALSMGCRKIDNIQAVTASDGAVYVVWYEEQSHSLWRVKMQHLSRNGARLWREGGFDCGLSSQFNACLKPDYNGGCFLIEYVGSG